MMERSGVEVDSVDRQGIFFVTTDLGSGYRGVIHTSPQDFTVKRLFRGRYLCTPYSRILARKLKVLKHVLTG